MGAGHEAQPVELDGSATDDVGMALQWFDLQYLADAELQYHPLGHFASDHGEPPVDIVDSRPAVPGLA